jgi:hypothetical protein
MQEHPVVVGLLGATEGIWLGTTPEQGEYGERGVWTEGSLGLSAVPTSLNSDKSPLHVHTLFLPFPHAGAFVIGCSIFW